MTKEVKYNQKKEMNCILYLRVSSEDQVKNFSLSSQEEICKASASRLGYEITNIFKEEGQSAKTADRPELIKLLEYCRLNKNKIASVMVYRIDRMARQTSDFLAIKKRLYELGIKLESATEPTGDSPTEKFIETILAASAQLDNEVRGDRARIGLRKRFEAGFVNRPPIGYKPVIVDGKKIAVQDDNFELIKKAWMEMATGTKTLSEISTIMNDWGIKVRWGNRLKPMTKQTAGKTFRNKFYCGYLVSPKYGLEVKGVHTPMVSEQIYYAVQAIITGKRNTPFGMKRLVSNERFPLRGIVKCYCGKSLVAGNCRGHGGVYPKYWCPLHSSPSISSKDLEKKLAELLEKLQPKREAVDMFTIIMHTDYNKRLGLLNKLKKDAETRIMESKTMLSLLVEGNLKGKYSDEIFNEQKKKIEDQILASKIVINDSVCDRYDIEAATAFVKALLYDLAKAYDVSTYGQKRLLLGSICPSGLVFKNGELLNPGISPIVSPIQAISEGKVLSSAGDRT